jgi:hypothetical protein
MSQPNKYKKILLALLPFWTPLIPPQGICRLKGFLQSHGYQVTTVDANTDPGLKNLYDRYFAVLKRHIPADHLGNLYNIGNDVWRDHMMAHLHQADTRAYLDLARLIVERTFYHRLGDDVLAQLAQVLESFYARLAEFWGQVLERERPDVLGVSTYRDTLAASLFALRQAKRWRPDLLTVMGGTVFATILPLGSPNLAYFLEQSQDCLDKLIVGPGEELFLKLLKGELPAGQRLFSRAGLPGPVLRVPVEMLDYSDLDLAPYYYQAAAGSYSCPNRCSFCNAASYLGEYQERDPAHTVRDMIGLQERYGIQLFYMQDSLLNGVIDGLAQRFLDCPASLYWDGYLRVEDAAADPERVHRWRRGGFYRARMGVESGSQRVLDLMGKRITVEQSRRTIRALAQAGIKTTAYMVIGHPGESEDDFQRTLDLMEELQDDIWEAESNPFTYFYSGQPQDDQWQGLRRLLFPESAREMLVSQTWILDCQPSRQEMFKRVNRFVGLCQRLGIATPWSLHEVQKSDQRWRRLHRNAVPATMDFIARDRYLDECKSASMLRPAQAPVADQSDFDFA